MFPGLSRAYISFLTLAVSKVFEYVRKFVICHISFYDLRYQYVNIAVCFFMFGVEYG